MEVSESPADQQVTLSKATNEISISEAANSCQEKCQTDGEHQDNAERPETVQTVIDAVTALGIRDVSQFTQVESDYYEWELQRRADRVNAPSEAHLCKTLIFENTRCTHNEISDPLYSRYYCVITQYIAPVNAQKLLNFGRRLKNKEISKKYYKFRLADPEVSFQLTGFRKGGVCPFGMKQPLPVILAESITKLEPPVLFLGAGHTDWKMGVPVSDFIKTTQCWVVDLE